MLVFVDESGDPGLKCDSGSTPYFTSALVIFEDDEAAEAVRARIRLLRTELGCHPRREFKFNRCSKEERISFLQAVQPYDFCYYGIVINKVALWSPSFKGKETFYKSMNRWVFDNASSLLKDAVVTIDGSGSKAFRRDLRHLIKEHVNRRQSDGIRDVKILDSSSDNLLQLADMVVGGLARSFGSKTDATVYRELLRGKEKRVQFWPK